MVKIIFYNKFALLNKDPTMPFWKDIYVYRLL